MKKIFFSLLALTTLFTIDVLGQSNTVLTTDEGGQMIMIGGSNVTRFNDGSVATIKIAPPIKISAAPNIIRAGNGNAGSALANNLSCKKVKREIGGNHIVDCCPCSQETDVETGEVTITCTNFNNVFCAATPALVGSLIE